MTYWLIIRRSDSTVLCCQITDPGDISNDKIVVKKWYGRAVPAHDPEEGVESYDPTLGLEDDDLQLVSEMENLRGRVETLEKTIEKMEVSSA